MPVQVLGSSIAIINQNASDHQTTQLSSNPRLQVFVMTGSRIGAQVIEAVQLARRSRPKHRLSQTGVPQKCRPGSLPDLPLGKPSQGRLEGAVTVLGQGTMMN
jgi:hypothetical protein